MALSRLRLASNTRRRQADGTWGEKPNYFDVVVWGAQADAAKRFLSKGSAVAVDGRLEWHEWTTEAGEKRQAVEVVADNLEFLDRRPAGGLNRLDSMSRARIATTMRCLLTPSSTRSPLAGRGQ